MVRFFNWWIFHYFCYQTNSLLFWMESNPLHPNFCCCFVLCTIVKLSVGRTWECFVLQFWRCSAQLISIFLNEKKLFSTVSILIRWMELVECHLLCRGLALWLRMSIYVDALSTHIGASGNICVQKRKQLLIFHLCFWMWGCWSWKANNYLYLFFSSKNHCFVLDGKESPLSKSPFVQSFLYNLVHSDGMIWEWFAFVAFDFWLECINCPS